MTALAIAASDYYTIAELIDILETTGIDEEELNSYLELDFIEEGEEPPTAQDMIDHIDYQQRLFRISSAADSENEMGILWAEAFCF